LRENGLEEGDGERDGEDKGWAAVGGKGEERVL